MTLLYHPKAITHVLAWIPHSFFLFQVFLIPGGGKSQISGCYTSIKQCPVMEHELFYHDLENNTQITIYWLSRRTEWNVQSKQANRRKPLAHYGETLWNRGIHIHTRSHNTSQVITELYLVLQKGKKKCLKFSSDCMFRTSDAISSHSPFSLTLLSIPLCYINHLSSFNSLCNFNPVIHGT